MTICLKDRLGGIAQVMELTKLMGKVGKDKRHRLADGFLSIGDDRTHGHGKLVAYLA
jgi:hypothetical protein